MPTDALCDVLGWGIHRLGAAAVSLDRQLEGAGAVVVDDGGAMSVADDLAAVDRSTVDRAARAVFG